ncbi:MAG: hypothetical protein HC905_12725 [Bacteroidales bacterium]|nr:hypothetical protein [Bacteroidales bacterium]
MTSLNRNIAPLIKKIERFNIIEARKYKLDNGIPVFTINNGDQDIIKIDLFFLPETGINPCRCLLLQPITKYPKEPVHGRPWKLPN